MTGTAERTDVPHVINAAGKHTRWSGTGSGEQSGGVLIAAEGVLQDAGAGLLKVTDVAARLDDAAAGGAGHEDHAHRRVVDLTVERPRGAGVPVEFPDGAAVRDHDHSLACQQKTPRQLVGKSACHMQV